MSAATKLADQLERWTIADIEERWNAVLFDEREAFLRFGTRHAPWESTPDYAARILKADSNISLENAEKVVAVFRAAYNELARPPLSPAPEQEKPQ